jgi:hypothetical protein
VHTHSLIQSVYLAHILRLRHLARHRPKIAVESPTEELEQHLEADPGESWVVTAPAKIYQHVDG